MENIERAELETVSPRHPRSGVLRLVVLSLCLFAFALYLFRIDSQPIWWDEAISVHLANLGLPEIADNRAGNLHPPLYFFLLKGWVALTGDSAFSVRFLSAWGAVLLIPALYAFGRRWFGCRVGLVAAIFGLLSPLYLVYAQEARVYALMPLVYLAILNAAGRVALTSPAPRWSDFMTLAAVEALSLSLHYTSFFAVAFVFAVLALRMRNRSTGFVRLMTIQAFVALLLVPWLVAVLTHADALDARLAMSNWQDEPITLAHFIRLVWVFQLTGQTGLISDPLAVVLTTLLAILLVLSLFLLLGRRGDHRDTWMLLLAWLVPLVSAFAVWWMRPRSHPRYVIAFTSAFTILLAYVVDRLYRQSRLGQVAAAGLVLALVAPYGLGLAVYHTPRFAKDDTRGVAAAIAARSDADDLVIVPPEDWSVPYYYDGPAQVDMSWAGDRPADWDRLADQTSDAGRVFLVDYNRATRDPRGIYPFALEAAGTLVERQQFKGVFLREYWLEHSVTPPQLGPVDARFGPLRLTGAWVEQNAPSDSAVTMALRWHLEEPVDTPLRGGLQLRGDEGWHWATIDDWLLDHDGYPTDDWTVGQGVTTYHVLPLLPGTPPLVYDLTLGVYQVGEDGAVRPLDLVDAAGNPQGQSISLAQVALAQPLGLPIDPYLVDEEAPGFHAPVDLGAGLTLLGASLDRESAVPGQPVFVTLAWRVDVQFDAPLTAALTLMQGDGALVALVQAVGGDYPVNEWQVGQLVVERRRLVIPPDAGDGPATVQLRVGEAEIRVGEIVIAAGEHIFELPLIAYPLRVRFGDVAELLGYDLDVSTVTSGEPVPITLYWRALDGANGASYTVFTHILADDGRLVGQHDGLPAGGGRPTPGWVAEEIIVDRHEMTFREPYTGPAQIELGLYDAVTVDRVPTDDGALYIILPVALDVIQP
jgi:4-amino-4-deoxy-L-arabinose transferase-like glycosyltransferase